MSAFERSPVRINGMDAIRVAIVDTPDAHAQVSITTGEHGEGASVMSWATAFLGAEQLRATAAALESAAMFLETAHLDDAAAQIAAARKGDA